VHAYMYTWKDNRLSDCQPVCLAGHTFTGQTNEERDGCGGVSAAGEPRWDDG